MKIIQEQCAELNRLRGIMRQIYEFKQKEILRVSAKPDKELREVQIQCDVLRHAILRNLETARADFSSPKTREFSGITVGFEKERDKVIPPDEPVLVDRIEKMLAKKQADMLLDRTTTVIKNAFKKLPREILQKLGCNFVTGADKPVVRANDDDIETLVKKSVGESKEAK